MTELLGAEHAREIKSELAKLAASLSALTEKIPTSVQKLIDSNEQLSKASSKYAKALCWLTGGLIFVGLLPYLAETFHFKS